MVEISLVSAESLRKLIGKESKTCSLDIEKGAIGKFATAVGDSNPLYRDERYAKNTRFSGIVAPEGMFFGFEFSDTGDPIVVPASHILDGGGEWEFLRPARPGDTLTFKRKLVDVNEREGRTGKMYFVSSEYTWTNQRGELVAKAKTTIISY